MSERSVVVRIRAEIGDFRKQMQEASKVTEKLGQTVQETGKKSSAPLDETAKKAGIVREELIKAGAAAQATAQGFGLSYDATGQLRDQFGRLVTGAKAASLGLETVSDATREFAAEQQHAADQAKVTDTALGQMVQSAGKHEHAWSLSGATLLGFGAAVSVGVGLAIKSYMQFDKAMSEVRAATHASAGDMELLRGAAIKAGADTSFSAREAADAITELSKAGVSTRDILSGGLDGALSLAAAGSLEVADAAELAATAMVQFKLKGTQIPHLADLLAAGAGKAQGSVEDLGNALKQGGLIAASTGLSIEETTGGLAAFASAGLVGSDAGTSFKTMLQSLTPNSVAAKNEMDRLGISAYDQQGKFVGLSKFAGILQTSMKGLTDEQRNASMKIIFGSDAVRAANVLYEQGAKGISDWTAKVNDSGYAAATAAIKQDNLSGDIEKVGGSLDSVFLKSGSGANEVLRGLAQTADTLIDSVGKLPGPLLQTTLGLSATAGGAALVGGAFLTTFPKVIETKRAFDELRTSSPKLADGLGKVGKAAGVAAATLVTLQVAGAISKTWAGETKTVEDYAQAFLTLGTSTKDLDAVVKNTGGLGTQINGVGDALVRVNDFDWYDNLNNWAGDMIGGTSRTQEFRNSVKGLDNTLVGLVQNGGSEKAGKSFKILAEEADKSAKAQGKVGLSTADVLKLMPQYTESLKAQGTSLGLKLEQHELEDLALGKIPPRMAAIQSTTEGAAAAEKFQAAASEEAAKKLDDMGLAADGTILSMSKLLDLMFASGLIQLSANEAAIKWQESLEGMDATFIKYGKNLDITTEGGKANQRALDGMASAGIANAKAMAENGATQEQLQGNLRSTYDALIAAYDKFDITGTAADDMARSVLGIPKDVPIETSIQNYADTMAKTQAIKNALDGINPNKTIFFRTDASGFYDPSAGTDGKGAGSGGADRVTPKAYANGGINGAFGTPHVFAANGLHRQSMIARGGANITWAEPETGWEAYISGKPGQESRNRGILQTIAPRFGLEAVPSKSMAGGYGQTKSFSGNGNGVAGGSNVTFSPQIHVTGAADTGAVVQEVWGKFQFEAQKAGLRIGG